METISPDRLDDWDPLHSPSAPATYWTTTNVGEAIPGLQTPLSWSSWCDTGENCGRYAAYELGVFDRTEREVPADVNDRYVRVFYGRAAMQLGFLTTLGDRMPGTTGKQVASQVFGSVPDDIVYAPTRRRYPMIAWRLPYCFLTVPRRVKAAAARTDRWYRATLPRVPELDLPGALDLYRDAHQRHVDLVALQTIALFAVVQPLYDAVSRLVAATGVGDLGTLSGSGGPEMNVVIDIWLASRGELAIEQVLAAHGFHGPLEGELSSHVWREDSRPLERMIDEYRRLDASADPRRQAERLRVQRAEMARAVIAAVPTAARPAVRGLLAIAGRGILLRGVAKRSFLQAFDTCRAAARRAGELLAANGTIGQPEDVFYLVADELTRPGGGDLVELVAQRRQRRARYEALLPLPETWRGLPPAIPRDTAPDPSQETVTGIGVSAGRVEGVARVLTTPDFDEVTPGEILVAPTTDPGWSSVMFISSALVVDIGGALSHAALVAREMGIPCVVNTRDGTRAIRTGDRVQVDGGAGTVEILERAASAVP
jgi:phosphohistidine swiveling domain-containing protein